jgi:hypothetical protein
VIAHELAHTRGMTHATMRGNTMYWRIGSHSTTYAWGNDLPLEVKVRKVIKRPTADVKMVRAQKMLKTAVTREKRVTTLRK